jgi:hypothetical protein
MTRMAVATKSTVHERYRRLVCGGLSPQEAAGLIARIDGIECHVEGAEPSATTWRWQEIARLEFLAYLVGSGRLADSFDRNNTP